MAFMEPQVEEFDAYRIDTSSGIFIIPCEFSSERQLRADYGDNEVIYNISTETGWYGRLSAPGYLDCTEWCGPFDTEKEAKAHLAETYDLCPECLTELDSDYNCPECQSITCGQCGTEWTHPVKWDRLNTCPECRPNVYPTGSISLNGEA